MNVKINHPTDRPNFTAVEIGDLTLWFSYQTVVGFERVGHSPVVIENRWGPTTGKHLNYIDQGKKQLRLTPAQFGTALNEALGNVST
jgi:hypothetical protein